MTKPFQHLYDRCDQLDVTLSLMELGIVYAAHPEKVELYFRAMKQGVLKSGKFEEACDIRDKEVEVEKIASNLKEDDV